ncbi:MAG: flagellar hook-associated protein FlgK [Lachnospiraceae bacterium]|nr:flagellar hook-associated protein FlgK [Lachnospiraceae bacterium]
MGLMGSLYIGTSGLQTGQNALNTVAHNLTNASTAGYTRQQVLLNDRKYNTLSNDSKSVAKQQTGLGVCYAQTRQVRDYFLDKTYRKEAGRCAFYEVSYEAMSQVENLLGEMDGKTFHEALNNLWVTVQELAKDPTSAVNQGALVQRATQFVGKAQSVYSGLAGYQDNLNLQVKDSIDRVNEIGKQIYELNNQILNIEVGGTEKANDLKDTRNALLDELGKLTNMSYSTDYDGCVAVKIEGHQFVDRATVYEMNVTQDSDTGFYTPYWVFDAKVIDNPDGSQTVNTDGALVFDLERTIASELNTDIGMIKGKMLARGDHRANYTDLDPATYNDLTSQSILMNIQAEIDNLVHEVVTKINGVLADGADPASGYLMDGSEPLRLFHKISDDGVAEDLAKGKEYTLYSIDNLVVNPELVKTPTLLNFKKQEKSTDYNAVYALEALFDEEIYSINPNVTTKTNFSGLYNNIVSQVANSGSVFKNIYESQQITVDSTEAARQQVMGVSDDEELSNMIKFQNAYNASSRYINVIDEMLEHIINTLGA